MATFLSGLIASAALCQQRPDAPAGSEFAVSTTRSYLPGEKPNVAVYYRGLGALDFRVYRVEDPVALFSKLKDPHQFGQGRQDLLYNYRVAAAPLERVHNFKRDLRQRIRDFFKQQLSRNTRDALVERRAASFQGRGGGPARPQRLVLNAASFAAVPLLNPNRLTVSWRELLPISTENQRAVLPVDVKDPGVYLVEAVNGKLTAYAVLVITDLGLVTKSSAQQMVVYAADRRTGRPVAGADLLFYREGQRIGGGRTNSEGVVMASLPAGGSEPDEGDEPGGGVLVMARAGARFAVSSLAQYEVGGGASVEYRGYLFTDRPVYRPGHKVHFKGIVRVLDRGHYLAPGGEATVQIRDAEGSPVFNQEYKLNHYGSFSGTWEISEEPPLGSYQLEATVNGKQAGSHTFRVEEYRKPEFEVKVAVERPQYLQGEKIRASISARYYFGAPVSSARVKYLVFRSRYWPSYWMEYLEDSPEFSSYEADDDWRYYMAPEQVFEQEGKLDADGKLSVELPTEVSPRRESYTYRVEARVTDAADREVSGAHFASVLYSDIAVFGHTDRYLYTPNETAVATFRALDQQGKPLAGPLQVTVVRRQWIASDYKETELQKTTVPADSSGVAKFSYQASTVGSYVLRAERKDSRGRTVSGDAWLYVWARGYAYEGGGGAESRIQIVPDKKKYKVGETARVLISLPKGGGHVLVTAEGQQVYSAWVREAASPAISVDVPIAPNFSPNFYLAAAYVKDNRFYEGTRNIAVPADDKRLTVEVSSDRAEYKPGQDAAYVVTVRDAGGRPVSAEVSLGIVDEAIYGIRADNAPDIHKFFYSQQYSRVNTRFSAYYHFYGYSGEKRMELVFHKRPYQLSDFKEEGEQPVTIRRRFLDTAYWTAHLATDASGRAQVRLPLPDNLTTWRATARAVTADTRAGAAVQKVLARKNLMLRLQTPRFFTQRDSAAVVGIVHNYLPAVASVRVSLEGTDIHVKDGAPRTVSVPKDGTARVEWRVDASAPGEAKFLARAVGDVESDALELRVPIRPYGLPVTQARSGSLTEPEQALAERFTLPAANQETSSLRVDISPSAAGTLLSALEYLTTFPYGCVEQTMSSFLPNVVVARTVKELKLPPPGRPEALERKVKAGLKRLYGFQHEDGGWGWWTNDETHPFMTAYVVYGLREAQLAGYEVSQEVMTKGLKSLAEQLGRDQVTQGPGTRLVLGNETRAYMSYALLSANPKAPLPLDALFQARGQLSPLGKALLALALAAKEGGPTGLPTSKEGGPTGLPTSKEGGPTGPPTSKDPRAVEMAAELERLATTTGAGDAYWDSRVDPMLLHGVRENSVQASAFAVKALAGLKPASPLLPRAVRWLVGHRRSGYYWDTTLTTATVIFGITDYLRVSKELEADYQLEVLLNGKPLLARSLTRADVMKLQPITVRVPAAQLIAGENELAIRKRGAGSLYWSVVATHYAGGESIPQVQRSDLSISREYFRVTSEKQGDRYIYREEPFRGPARVGDLVSVRLRVTGDRSGSRWEYLLVEDPLPAGFETVERDDLFEFERAPDWYANPWWTRRELHDDRVSFFQTSLYGRHEVNYRYLIRASTGGSFQVMPARVTPMYQPEVQATTTNTRISVETPGGVSPRKEGTQ